MPPIPRARRATNLAQDPSAALRAGYTRFLCRPCRGSDSLYIPTQGLRPGLTFVSPFGLSIFANQHSLAASIRSIHYHTDPLSTFSNSACTASRSRGIFSSVKMASACSSFSFSVFLSPCARARDPSSSSSSRDPLVAQLQADGFSLLQQRQRLFRAIPVGAGYRAWLPVAELQPVLVAQLQADGFLLSCAAPSPPPAAPTPAGSAPGCRSCAASRSLLPSSRQMASSFSCSASASSSRPQRLQDQRLVAVAATAKPSLLPNSRQMASSFLCSASASSSRPHAFRISAWLP